MKNLILPLIIGTAATAAIAYFLISEGTAGLKGELFKNLMKSCDKFKDKMAEKIS